MASPTSTRENLLKNYRLTTYTPSCRDFSLSLSVSGYFASLHLWSDLRLDRAKDGPDRSWKTTFFSAPLPFRKSRYFSRESSKKGDKKKEKKTKKTTLPPPCLLPIPELIIRSFDVLEIAL